MPRRAKLGKLDKKEPRLDNQGEKFFLEIPGGPTKM